MKSKSKKSKSRAVLKFGPLVNATVFRPRPFVKDPTKTTPNVRQVLRRAPCVWITEQMPGATNPRAVQYYGLFGRLSLGKDQSAQLPGQPAPNYDLLSLGLQGRILDIEITLLSGGR